MSSKQKHRGQHSNDPRLFSEKFIPILNRAVEDLSWLLGRGYSEKGSIELVGNRHRLNVRQRKALARAACADQARESRQQKRCEVDDLTNQSLIIDGYNLLITVESALGGGIVIECRDGCFRDIASIHGTYRRVEETLPALTMIGVQLQQLQVSEVYWLLDRPVSNSGRLKTMMGELAGQYGFPWEIELVNNPDRTISERTEHIAVSSDGWVLDHSPRWYNLNRYLLNLIPKANIIRLQGEDPT